MTYGDKPVSSDSVNLGSNPSSPATGNAGVSGISSDPSAAEKSEITEQIADTGRTEVGTGHIYFVSDGEAVKIGFSEKPKRRISSLQTSHSKPLTLLCTIASSALSELDVHERFAHLRIRGEWFQAEPELLSFISEVSSGHVPTWIRTEAPKAPTVVDLLRQEMATLAGQDDWPPEVRCYIKSISTMLASPDEPQFQKMLPVAVQALESNVQWWKRVKARTQSARNG